MKFFSQYLMTQILEYIPIPTNFSLKKLHHKTCWQKFLGGCPLSERLSYFSLHMFMEKFLTSEKYDYVLTYLS